MSKSAHLRLADLRAIYQLVGECRELGDDVARWRRHLLSGLAQLTRAGFAVGGEVGAGGPGTGRDLGTIDWGAEENGFDKAGWLQMIEAFQSDPFSNLIVNAYLLRLPAAAGAGLSRADLVPDGEWYRSSYYQALHRTLGADATLACIRPLPGSAGEACDVYLLRRPGEPDFSARQKAIVAEVMATVVPLVGGPLARFADPSPADLPPRAREVLGCLLEGDGDKQIAGRLGITRSTVNQYAKVIFRHFGVQARAELLALWVRRWRRGGFARADDELPPQLVT